MGCKSVLQSSRATLISILPEDTDSRKCIEKPPVAVVWQRRRRAYFTRSFLSRKVNGLNSDENQGYKFYEDLVSHKSYVSFSFSRASLLMCHSRPTSFVALNLDQLQWSQQVKHLKWQIKWIPLCCCLQYATYYAARKKKPLKQCNLVASVRNIPLRTQTQH